MYYSSGNYEAFARPRKPARTDRTGSVHLVGAGLASLSAAGFLVRDGQVPGDRITVYERLRLAGGALDGIKEPRRGFVIRGGRELEDHMECLWDLFRSVPSIETDGVSVLDEFYWLNKDDPNFSLQRVTEDRGKDARFDNLFRLDDKAQKDLTKIFLARREDMEGKTITDVMSKHFLESQFWLYWRTMFAFQEWHSALEFKLYLHRFIHHVGGLPDLSALKFTKYNQYESMVLPLTRWLMDQGVTFRFHVEVIDVDVEQTDERTVATAIHLLDHGADGPLVEETIELGEDDLVLATIGSLTENSDNGDQHTPARVDDGPAPAWDLWKRLAAKSDAFGRPEVFCTDIARTKWQSATVTTLDGRIPEYIERITRRSPFTGKVVTGGIVTARDSAWLMSWTINRQPHFKAQPPDQVVVWVYGLFVDKPGDYVKKALQDCTGEEITQEWLYHLGVPEAEIPTLAADAATCVPVMMPYVTAFFMPRHAGDRPQVVPRGSVNLAFLGQFAETTRDVIFTTEYSVRTGMEAAYQLLDIERGVPEVFNSTYDVRKLLSAMSHLRDGEALHLHGPRLLRERLLKKVDDTELGELLAEFSLLATDE